MSALDEARAGPRNGGARNPRQRTRARGEAVQGCTDAGSLPQAPSLPIPQAATSGFVLVASSVAAGGRRLVSAKRAREFIHAGDHWVVVMLDGARFVASREVVAAAFGWLREVVP